MGQATMRGRCLRLSGLLLLAITGCTISIQPWSKHAPTPPPVPPDGNPFNPAAAAKNGGVNQAMINTDTAKLIEQLNREQDRAKAAESRIFSLNQQLKDRDVNLRQAGLDIEATSKQIKQTREELRQWQGEMDDMRERIRKSESFRSSMTPLIEEIHRYLRDKESPRMKLPPVNDR